MHKLAKKIMQCRMCSISGVLLGVSTIVLTATLFIFGVNFIRSSEITNAQNELKEIKRQYEEVIIGLQKLQNFSPEQYDNIGKKSYTEAGEALTVFRNVFIAAAMLTTQNGSRQDAIAAWKLALHTNIDSKICSYGLAMEYFRAGTSGTLDSKNAQLYLENAIKYFSASSLLNNPQAQYHIALASLRLMDFKQDGKEKYKLAYSAIETLSRTDPSKHPLGNVDRNLAYAYCIAGRYSTDNTLKMHYKVQSEKYFAVLKDVPEFIEFYEKHHQTCMQQR